MKLLRSNPWRGTAISRVFGSLNYSTNTLASSSTTSPTFQPLHHRILFNKGPRVSVLPVLHQWLKEGRDVEQSELRDFISKLRRSRCYNLALEISEWMGDEMNFDLHPGDIAIRLDLISRVHGNERAERYFDCIPNELRVVKVYGSLLLSYVEHRCLEKAEALFEKMKDLEFVKGPFTYNVMMNLYTEVGKYGKVDILVNEMEEKGIEYDIRTLNNRLHSYAATSDVGRMEKLLMKMEADPTVIVDWHAYAVAADAFLKAGELEKTSALLRKSERLITSKTRKSGYEFLMTSHAAVGNKHEVYRIWELYKDVGFYNSGYRCMISSLVKLDDIEGAEKIVEEWECGNKLFDIQTPNLLMNAYCKKGLLEKARSYAEKFSKGGKEDCRTWGILATGYHMNGQMAEAVETLKTAASLACRPGWKFDRSTVSACFDYLREKGDVEAAHELLRLFREMGHLPTDLFDKIGSYMDGGEPPMERIDKVQDRGMDSTV
ncbi:hypothetical protein ACFX13_034817 [Malus domestica]